MGLQSVVRSVAHSQTSSRGEKKSRNQFWEIKWKKEHKDTLYYGILRNTATTNLTSSWRREKIYQFIFFCTTLNYRLYTDKGPGQRSWQCKDYGLDDQSSNPARGQDIFLFAKLFRPSLASIQSLIKWVPSSFSGVNRTTHLPLAFWLWMSGDIPLLPHIGLHCVDRDTFTFTFIYI